MEGWIEGAGQHCEKVHQAEVVQPRDLGQVQADEIRAKIQGGILWLAMALMVPARLWLGGAISATRDSALIRQVVALIRACALPRALLLVTDGLATYLECFRRVFCTPQRTGQRGRPRLLAWMGVVIGQVVKRYQRRRVVADAAAGARDDEGVAPAADVDPRGRRAEHSLQRALECHLPRPAGGAGAVNPQLVAPATADAGRDVSGGHGVQLLHVSCQSYPRWAAMRNQG